MNGFDSGIKVVYSSKADGSMKRADGTLDTENIKNFLLAQKLPTNAVCMHQTHGNDTAVVSGAKSMIINNVDALITKRKDVSLCVVTADCLPIALHDGEKGVIGIAHAGHRGLRKGIIHSVISAMSDEFTSLPKDINVLIGPGIEEKCYEVGEEFIEQFASLPDADALYTKRDKKYYFSLQKAAVQYLLKEGILKEHILVSNECTKCSINKRYSYRNGDSLGRFVSAISLS